MQIIVSDCNDVMHCRETVDVNVIVEADRYRGYMTRCREIVDVEEMNIAG